MDDDDSPPSAFDSLELAMVDALAVQVIAPPLAPGTVVAGRYVVDEAIGSGGMGTVYRARDQQLEREVALKLHRTTAGMARLRREAIAMAKLAHPNVVTVFEVGDLDGRPFVAMEYVAGTTLRAWLETPRSRRAILDALTAAGQGLTAAHASGLVHRDVKPDNIFVGRDGRVRIGDFGLAQLTRTQVSGVSAVLGDATLTGTVVGTPAYMAPEQIDGGEIDQRTDQFAFAVVAWEALSGERPFGGGTTAELRQAIAGTVPLRGRDKLPPRLRRVLLRGLAADPAARFPTVDAMMHALRAAYYRPRVLAIAAAIVVVAGGAIAWAAWPERDPAAACDDIAGDVVIPDAGRVVAAVRSSGATHAAERAKVIEREIDALRARHTRIAREACVARARKQWSPELAAASAECLQIGAQTAREMLAAVPIAADSVADLQQVAARLPPLESCGDAKLLAGRRSLATAEHPLASVIGARAKLDVARMQLVLGRVPAARKLRAEVAALPVAAHPAIAQHLAFVDGAMQIYTGNYGEAERRLSEIYFAARARDDGELMLEVVAELISLTASIRRDHEAGARWVQNGLADAERERARQPVRAAHVIEATAAAASIAGESELAIERVALARRVGAPALTRMQSAALLGIEASAHADLGRIDEAIKASDAQLALLIDSLGEHHPAVADAFSLRAAALTTAQRIEEAHAAAKRSRAILDDVNASGASTTDALINLGAALIGANDNSGAIYLERARASLVSAFGAHHHDVALIDSNLALVYMDRGENDRALAALRSAVGVQELTLGANHLELASSLYNLAVAERGAKTYEIALATARRSEAIFAKRMGGSVRHVYSITHLALIENLLERHADALATAERAISLATDPEDPAGRAWPRLEAAKALIALRRDPARTRTLLAEARAGYAQAALPERVTEVDALLAKLR